MSTILSSMAMNMAEAQKRANYNGSQNILAELEKVNDIQRVFPWFPASDGTFHKYIKAKELGKGDFTDFNGGMPDIASVTDIKTMQILSMQANSAIDRMFFNNVTSKEQAVKIRQSQDFLNAQGFMQAFWDNVVYGNKAKGFEGFASITNKILAKKVWNAGANSANAVTSAYLIEFGEYAVCGRYAGATVPGLVTRDEGTHKTKTLDGKILYTVDTSLAISAGIEVYDDRALLRMANIATSGNSNLFNEKMALEMKNTLPNRGRNAVWLVNRTVLTQMESAILTKSNISYSRGEVEGFGELTHCVGIPVLLMDSIVDTEAVVGA